MNLHSCSSAVHYASYLGSLSSHPRYHLHFTCFSSFKLLKNEYLSLFLQQNKLEVNKLIQNCSKSMQRSIKSRICAQQLPKNNLKNYDDKVKNCSHKMLSLSLDLLHATYSTVWRPDPHLLLRQVWPLLHHANLALSSFCHSSPEHSTVRDLYQVDPTSACTSWKHACYNSWFRSPGPYFWSA